MLYIEININGEAYPYKETMGAMLRFKDKTGKDASKLNLTEVTDVATWIWCCVKSACQLEGKAFNMSLIDFADAMGEEQVQQWATAKSAELKEIAEKLQAQLNKGEEKKSQ